MASPREPLLKIQYRDPKDGWEGMLVIDSLVDGVCGGGFRVTRTVNLDEVVRLARAMSLKNHVMGLPLGGAKSAIRYDPKAIDLEDAMTRFVEHVRPICESMYGWGPDMNTPPDLCDAVAKRAGLKSRHMALAEKSEFGYDGVDRYNKALRLPVGPIVMTEARTAIGVAGAAERAAELYGLDRPLRISIQGFGSVGAGAVYFLEQRGHKAVGVADAGGYYRNPEGIDFETLYAAKAGGLEIDPSRLDKRFHGGGPDAIFDDECDVLILAAVADAVDKDRAEKLKTKMVVEGGNLTVTQAGHVALQARKIPVVPDFITNGGGIGIVSGMIQLGWELDAQTILDEIESRVAAAVTRSCKTALERDLSIRQAALLELPEWMSS